MSKPTFKCFYLKKVNQYHKTLKCDCCENYQPVNENYHILSLYESVSIVFSKGPKSLYTDENFYICSSCFSLLRMIKLDNIMGTIDNIPAADWIRGGHLYIDHFGFVEVALKFINGDKNNE